MSQEVFIRDVQPSDLPVIKEWENDPKNWSVSETKRAYTQEEIEALVASSMNFKDSKQKRWMICFNDKTPIGTMDVFQGDFPKGEVGVGVLIAEESNRKKSYAQQAIFQAMMKCIVDYSIHTFYADVHIDNEASKALFKKCEFEVTSDVVENPNFDKSETAIIRMKLCAKN